jgi:signal peptidase I
MKEKLRSLLHENKSLLLFIGLMIVFRSSFADWNTVPTGSMKPTIVEGDRILVNKLAYDIKIPLTDISLIQLDAPERGDIVVFNSEVADNRLVKRVIGLPGDVVAMSDNRLIINGLPTAYSDLQREGEWIYATESVGSASYRIRFSAERSTPLSSFAPVEVPEGKYLVLGDNRDSSADSRVIGFVLREEIAGRSKSVVMSLNHENYYLPRLDRFFHDL